MRGLLLCAFAGAELACGVDTPTSLAARAFDLSDVGIRAQFGDWEYDSLAVLRRPIDAAFVGQHVVILDASQPWGRVFDRQGNFIRSIVRHGDGPGEARSPRSIASAGDDQVLFAHPRGILRVNLEGTPTFIYRTLGVIVLRGVVEACNGTILALGRRLGETTEGILHPLGPGFVIRVGADLASTDTLLMLAPLRRGATMRKRTSYLAGSPSGVLLQTEEESNHRLIQVDCDGTVRRDIYVGPFGPPRRVVPGPRADHLYVRGEEPPYPGGLATMRNTILWATLVRDSSDADTARLTVVTAYDPDGAQREAILRGWVQLFDSDEAGMLLLGLADDLYPRVAVVDGNALLQRMRPVPRLDAN